MSVEDLISWRNMDTEDIWLQDTRTEAYILITELSEARTFCGKTVINHKPNHKCHNYH